ncbi:MAG: response regulator transcription factor [Desulfatiglans sp.]|nr:response regulator transcription factor [Desulfatiglans sp.]
MSNIKILIIDDEQPARKKLSSFIKNSGCRCEIHEATNGVEAVEKINGLNPQLVFLDIQMPGMTGFEVIENIGLEQMPFVVFVTAYDHYALDAFEVNAIDYLLKPFDMERFQKAFDKALDRIESNKPVEVDFTKLLTEINLPKRFKERFLVNQSSRYFFIQTEDIRYISSEEKYVSLHTDSSTFLLRETMNNMEERLDPDKFVRVHRSYLVNISYIKEIQPWSTVTMLS